MLKYSAGTRNHPGSPSQLGRAAGRRPLLRGLFKLSTSQLLAALTKISFWHLFHNHLKPGAYYVIEDWRVSYWEASVDGARYEWPKSTAARPPQFSQTMALKPQLPNYSDRIAHSVKKLLDTVGNKAITRAAGRFYRNQRYKSRRFPMSRLRDGRLNQTTHR